MGSQAPPRAAPPPGSALSPALPPGGEAHHPLTIVIQEEEEEGVHNGDEDATPERDSKTTVAWVSSLVQCLALQASGHRRWHQASWVQEPKRGQLGRGREGLEVNPTLQDPKSQLGARQGGRLRARVLGRAASV